MVESIFRAMYGNNPSTQKPTELERQKRAVKVLGGMKVHNSHIKRIQIGEDLIDVPKIEYMQLLEGQVRELRGKLRAAEAKMIRLENNHMKVLSELSNIRVELSGKVSLR